MTISPPAAPPLPDPPPRSVPSHIGIGGLFTPHSGVAAVVTAAHEDVTKAAVSQPPPPAGDESGVTVICRDPVPPLPGDVASTLTGADRHGKDLVATVGGDGPPSAPARSDETSPWTQRTGQMGDIHDDLARRAQDGDRRALEELLALIDDDGSVRVPIRSLVTDSGVVQDISQEVLIQVATRIGSWDGRGGVTAWVRAIARNKAIDHLRWRHPPGEALPEEIPSDARRLSSIIATQEAVRAAVEALPDIYRRPVLLREIGQMEYEAIAVSLGLPVTTVRTRVSRGRAMVAAAWVQAQE